MLSDWENYKKLNNWDDAIEGFKRDLAQPIATPFYGYSSIPDAEQYSTIPEQDRFCVIPPRNENHGFNSIPDPQIFTSVWDNEKMRMSIKGSSLTPELANLHLLLKPSSDIPANSCLISTGKLLQSEDFKIYLATIYGEAGGSSPDSWRAIANVINNRVGYKEWSKYKTQTDVIKYTRFDAYWQKKGPYTYAYNSLSSGKIDDKLNKMVSIVAPVYLHLVPDTTNGAVLYYSPRAQTKLAIKYPQQYKPVPKWNWDELQRLYPKGVKNDDFAFYKYQ